MSRDEVGSALAAIAQYNNGQETGPDGPALLGALLEQEMIIAAGGLRVRDTATGVRVEAGCCFGLENWRDWQDVLEGRTPYLGHTPSPRLEFGDGVARLWPDAESADGPACEIRIAELPALLLVVRRDLLGFLELVRRWAPYGMGEELAARFDEDFHISAPL
ncbi:hypothetical protein FXN61_25470 [Lentzea sp. PSKA42]|uniref:Immunity protein 63 n=1 Tax=Lentzea indica TaxID=2604800 RepID=A0ABX1FMC9_9PSEU|nr:hypothetical protein [Lentzea indica]NKE59967.1 hypothetical protein [Lentzea indica]